MAFTDRGEGRLSEREPDRLLSIARREDGLSVNTRSPISVPPARSRSLKLRACAPHSWHNGSRDG